MLDRSVLLESAKSFKLGELELPELGGKIFLRVISSRERDAIEQEISNAKGTANLQNIRAKMVIRAVSDADGKRVFSDADADLVGDMPAPLVGKIFDAACKHNGMTGEAVEDARKN